MTTIGLLGAGAIAQALVHRLLAVDGLGVVISNRRGPASLSAVTTRFGLRVRAGTGAEAGECDAVVLAVPWSQAGNALDGVREWKDRILIDATNALEPPTYRPADLGQRTASSHVIGDLAPEAKVVKAFNHLAPDLLADDPRSQGGRRVLFHASDHPDADTWVGGLIGQMGFMPVALGELAAGGLLMQFPGGPFPTRHLVQY